MKPKVFILILNWNGGENTIECLESLKNINYSNYEIVVIDNGSTDNSIQLIRQEFPEIKIILNHKNLGFAEGMNAGIREVIRNSKFKEYYILLLNQDVIVHPDFLAKLTVKAGSDSNIGITGPKIYYYQEAENGNRVIGNQVIWSCGSKFVSGRAFKMEVPYSNSALVGCWEIDRGQYDDTPIDSLPGCCMLIKSKVISEIGLLDSSFFLLHEDDDFCIRTKKAGYKICLVPESIIWHKVSTSLLGSSSRQGGTSSPTVAYYWYRNWFFVLAKHFSTKVFLKVLLSYALRIILMELGKIVNEKAKQKLQLPLRSYLLAFIDALKYKLQGKKL